MQPRRVLAEADVRRFAEERCFPAGAHRVGAELEWFVTGPAHHDEVATAAGAGVFPGGSTLTFEPGGQVELSSAPGDVVSVCAALQKDSGELQRRLAPIGCGLLAAGVHPDRDPVRVLDEPRYVAMDAYWSRGGEHDPGAGLAMMCTTAAVQVNVDLSMNSADHDRRWRLAHALSPVLSACFANSPMARGKVTGWRSTRLGIWEGLDRTRTAPALRKGHAVDDWTAYVLDANVMFIRAGGAFVPLDPGLSFGRWLAEGHAMGWPDQEDLVYHASTLFPPVRPRGYLELRCMDSVAAPWWAVAVAVAHALLDDEEAGDAAARATGRASWCWCEAPRWSLDYEPLADAARTCFTLARDALPRLGAAALVPVVEAYQERFVDRGLCPADQVLVG